MNIHLGEWVSECEWNECVVLCSLFPLRSRSFTELRNIRCVAINLLYHRLSSNWPTNSLTLGFRNILYTKRSNTILLSNSTYLLSICCTAGCSCFHFLATAATVTATTNHTTWLDRQTGEFCWAIYKWRRITIILIMLVRNMCGFNY